MPDKKRSHVVFVLPTYNEAENIKTVISNLQTVFSNEKNYIFSILVVDDNSPDKTADVVKRLQKKHKSIHLLTGKKQGLGAAYVRGMHYAVEKLSADILFEMDSDLSHDPMLVPKFLRKLEEGADYVVGSRYIKGGSIPSNWGADRKIFSVAGNFIIRAGFMLPQIHEWTSGYRAMHSYVFEKISPGLEKYKGYIFQIASMYRVVQAHFIVSEVPIHFIDRKYGKSKIIPSQYIPDILRYILTQSSFIRFVITGGIGFIVDFSIAAFLIEHFGVFTPTANAISAAVAVTSNFIINNYWSFGHKKITGGIKVMTKKYLQFVIVAVGSVFIQYTGMYAAIHLLGEHDLYFGSITLPVWVIYKIFVVLFLIIPYSYIMYNRVIWRKT